MKKILLVPLILVLGAAIGFVVVNGRDNVPKDRVPVSGMIETTEVDLSFKFPVALPRFMSMKGMMLNRARSLPPWRIAMKNWRLPWLRRNVIINRPCSMKCWPVAVPTDS